MTVFEARKLERKVAELKQYLADDPEDYLCEFELRELEIKLSTYYNVLTFYAKGFKLIEGGK